MPKPIKKLKKTTIFTVYVCYSLIESIKLDIKIETKYIKLEEIRTVIACDFGGRSLATLISFFIKLCFQIVCFVFYFFTMTVTSIGLSDNFINFVPSMFVFPK